MNKANDKSNPVGPKFTSSENQQKVRELFASMARGPLPMAPDVISPEEQEIYAEWKLLGETEPWLDYLAASVRKIKAKTSPK